jgi:hypothetical protein
MLRTVVSITETTVTDDPLGSVLALLEGASGLLRGHCCCFVYRDQVLDSDANSVGRVVSQVATVSLARRLVLRVVAGFVVEDDKGQRGVFVSGCFSCRCWRERECVCMCTCAGER